MRTHAKKLNSSLRVFLKSAGITAVLLGIFCVFIFGFFFADKNTSAASSTQGGFEISKWDNSEAIFEIMGKQYKLDFRQLEETMEYAANFYDLLPLNLRVFAEFSENEQDTLSVVAKEYFE